MRIFLFLIIFFVTACGMNQEKSNQVEMYNDAADLVGTATLTEQTDGVNVKLELEGLTNGFHGVHVHEYPKCDGPDFKSAGNHFNPEGKLHGLMHPEGAHIGDMPNIEADEDGKVEAEIMIVDATMLEGKKSLLKENGTSLIITKEVDDGVSQPGGDSGERIICGEIKPGDDELDEESPSDPTKINEDEDKEE